NSRADGVGAANSRADGVGAANSRADGVGAANSRADGVGAANPRADGAGAASPRAASAAGPRRPAPRARTSLPTTVRIFSGIQPTGRKHLGNYIGAITQYVAGQDRGEAIYCVVDLHATTGVYQPPGLRESVYDTAATLLAAGLEPDRCIFFRQSDVLEHTELARLLSSVTAFGDLNRMHQFKDKAGAQR